MKDCLGLALVFMLAATGTFGAEARPAETLFSVRAGGAAGDGRTLDTAAVQKTIDACAAAGGGTVHFGAGTYLCGSLHLKSNVCLCLDAGATIKASTRNEDFDPVEELGFKNDSDSETSFFHHALIWGEDVENVAVTGQGTIDGNRTKRHGPKNIALKRCKFVTIRGVRLLNCPNYNISMIGTDYVNIDGVTILNGFADGIDPDGCRNVRIANCHIESVDDAIVPKASFSLGERRSCENITVTNCMLATVCNCFKLGTESGGDFKRIAVSNCVMTGLGSDTATSGVALESVDGANIDGVTVSNITMTGVQSPIFLRLGNRGRDMKEPVPGSLRNVTISGVVAQYAGHPCVLSGIPGHPIEGVTLSNIRIMFRGSTVFRPRGEPVPEAEAAYPDAEMFGALPAYGLYCRHLSDLAVSNMQLIPKPGFWRIVVPEGAKVNDRNVDFEKDPPGGTAPAPAGTALAFNDVSKLTLDGVQAHASEDGSPVVYFDNVRDVMLSGCIAPENTDTYLQVAGDETGNILLSGNDLSRAMNGVGPENAMNRVVMKGNLER